MSGQKKHRGRHAKKLPVWKRVLLICGIVLLVLEGLYCLAVYSDIPFIAKMRRIYIDTAMSTMRHQWLATDFIPEKVIDGVMEQLEQSRSEQVGVNSTWETEPEPSAPSADPTEDDPPDPAEQEPLPPDTTEAELAFYELFRELDRKTMQSYLNDHPEALANGWEQLYINEAGLDDSGTSIRTVQGDQVLAVDAVNGILLIRVRGSGYRGVLAIGHDPAKLSVKTASTIGAWGQYAGTIASENGGVLAMTASSFLDEDEEGNLGQGNGGILCGYAMSDGTEYGDHMSYGYKRLEIHSDNRMYVTDALSPVGETTRDAVEFTPAMIVDGKVIVDEYCGWNAVNPRACIGQNDREEVMLLCIEGRLILTSLGTGVVECANILSRYGCMQAMNLDGGTSAILWYQGECVIQCSNTDCPYGRTLPNAFVYAGKRLDQ